MVSDYEDGSHAKFKNFIFDVDEFERLVNKIAVAVQNDHEYVKFLKRSQPVRIEL